jgi:hypothetical protein
LSSGRGNGAAFRIHAPGEKVEMPLLLKGVEAAAHLWDKIGAMLAGGARDYSRAESPASLAVCAGAPCVAMQAARVSVPVRKPGGTYR